MFPTGLIKARHFLYHQHLKDIECASDPNFFIHWQVLSSLQKVTHHNLEIALCILTGEVKSACCSCLAGRLGFHQHMLALILRYVSLLSIAVLLPKICARNRINNLDLYMCTSQLPQWHKKDGEKHTAQQPVTEIDVNNAKVNESRSGINNLLCAATRNTYHSESAEQEFKNQSQYGSLQVASKQYTQANPTKT